MPYIKIKGRRYLVKVFYNEKETNSFLEKNPGWGVLAEIDKTIYVARLIDLGQPESK